MSIQVGQNGWEDLDSGFRRNDNLVEKLGVMPDVIRHPVGFELTS